MAKGLGINERRAVGREEGRKGGKKGGRVGWGIISMTVGTISSLSVEVKISNHATE